MSPGEPRELDRSRPLAIHPSFHDDDLPRPGSLEWRGVGCATFLCLLTAEPGLVRHYLPSSWFRQAPAHYTSLGAATSNCLKLAARMVRAARCWKPGPAA